MGNVERAGSWPKKALGLMFRKKQDKPLILQLDREAKLGASIHCFFMRFPIDVLFLDSQKSVVDIALNVKPWTFNVTPRRPARYVVELPAGKALNARIGERVYWAD